MLPFVGIIAENKDYEIIEKSIREDVLKIKLMQLKEDYIENIKNVKFDTIVVNKEVLNNKQYLKQILENSNYLVINSDINLNLKDYSNIKSRIITYGFNNKATVTASSVTENNIVICTQRNIEGINKKQIEQQESNIKREKNKFENPYNVMLYFIIHSIYKQ